MPENVGLLTGGQASLASHPDVCPICHHQITPVFRVGVLEGRKFEQGLRVLYSCPNAQCRELFIGYFANPTQGQPHYRFLKSRPLRPQEPTFSEIVKTISPTFCDVYAEAHTAEELELGKICGVGYRKALEFLVKDYLIRQLPDKKDKIEAAQLGTCIDNYVADPRVKEVSKRAAWLGNDETHYQRRWVDKDLTDLKSMISLVLHWIEMEHLTAEALESMPPRSAG